MKKEIKFELGSISPREGHFDHHGQVDHRNGFIVKMAAVQLLEWVAANNYPPIKIDMNHCGHLDDFCAHAVNLLLKEKNLKMDLYRALYKFTATVSVIDSCGPCFEDLIDPKYLQWVQKIRDHYHKLLDDRVEELNVQKFKLPLKEKIAASKQAGALLIGFLKDELLETPEIKYKKEEFEVDPSLFEFTKIGDWGLVSFLKNAGKNTPFIPATHFYPKASKLIILNEYEDEGIIHKHYSLFCKTPYHGDLTLIYPKLNELETLGQWGGHSGAGGSPRDTGSSLDIETVIQILNS